MFVGKIIGKATTKSFDFMVEQPVKKFDFLQVYHKNYDRYVLCQINEIEKQVDGTIAVCSVIGFRDDEGRLKQIRVPFDINAEVLLAHEDFIKQTIQSSSQGFYVGRLEGKNINVYLNPNTLLSKHVAVLAKSGAGKSYAVGVLIEEILEKGIPLIIIDPHGEYSTLKNPNTKDKERLRLFGLKERGYPIKEYGNLAFLHDGLPLRVKDRFSPIDIEQIVPNKLSPTQQALLFSIANQLSQLTIPDLLAGLEAEENPQKWSLINMLQYIKDLGYFTPEVDYKDFLVPGQATIINLRGIAPEIQEVVVYKLLKDLFDERKRGTIPPFFTVIEEAHNFCPERSFGEKKSSKIIRDVAAEGRKFGMGLCVISQRPARVEKSVLSQCSTQMILKITNPNDLKAVLNAVEGLTSESYEEIKNLPIGTAMVAGVVDMPLVINIRPRKSLHGGETVQIFAEDKEFVFVPPAKQARIEAGTDKERKDETLVASLPREQEPSIPAVQEEPEQETPQASLPIAQAPTPLPQEEETPLTEEEETAAEDALQAEESQPLPAAQEEAQAIQGRQALLPVLEQELSEEDYAMMYDAPLQKVLVPVRRITCKDDQGTFPLLIDLSRPAVITDIAEYATGTIPSFSGLSREQLTLLKDLYQEHQAKPFALADFKGDRDLLSSLIARELLVDHNDTVAFNPDLLFSRLRRYAQYAEFGYRNVRYDEQLESAPEEAIEKLLSQIAKIHPWNEGKDGWYLRFAPENSNQS